MLYTCYFSSVFIIFSLTFVQGTHSESDKDMNDITAFKANTYCKFQANRFRCGKSQRGQFKYYYNTEKNTCEHFVHGNCYRPYNTFSSAHSCKSECKDLNIIPTFRNLTQNIFCRLQPEFGNCNSYYPRWYFDISEMTCRGFSYSGCGGNDNNFDNTQKCLDICAVVKQCKPSLEKPTEILSCYT